MYEVFPLRMDIHKFGPFWATRGFFWWMTCRFYEGQGPVWSTQTCSANNTLMNVVTRRKHSHIAHLDRWTLFSHLDCCTPWPACGGAWRAVESNGLYIYALVDILGSKPRACGLVVWRLLRTCDNNWVVGPAEGPGFKSRLVQLFMPHTLFQPMRESKNSVIFLGVN